MKAITYVAVSVVCVIVCVIVVGMALLFGKACDIAGFSLGDDD